VKSLTARGAADRWVADHRDELVELLHEYGALHVAGASASDPATLAAIREAWGATAAPPHEQFAARSDLGHGVYSAPVWAGDREMCHHHEQSYGVTYPRLLFIAGIRAPARGGTMLLADTRRALDALPDTLRQRFADLGWRLVRNYRPYLGLSWAAALGVADQAQASGLLAARGVDAAWAADGSLRTSQRRPAVTRHPVTGEPCWFNDVAFFNQWSVDETERAVMLSAFGPDGLPMNTFFGDGEPLSRLEFQAVLDAYDKVTDRVELRPGELLVVDNVLTAHGREPYTGDLDLAVALAT
jgi:alpha-ketoglutarate-dependent taurine dioxygenase